MSKAKIKIGDVFKINTGGTVRVVEYINAHNVRVEHQDDNRHISTVEAGQLRCGRVKNPYKPIVFNVGYLGSGDYQPSINGKTTQAMNKWQNMLRRGYCLHYKKRFPTYQDVTVCEEWHNFQNFAEWYYRQPNHSGVGFELDKDLIQVGNKEYRPEFCSLVPKEINYIICSSGERKGDIPRGVRRTNHGYYARARIDGKTKHSSIAFNTPEEAHLEYIKMKSDYVKKVAEKYKNVIHPKVYENLISWGQVYLQERELEKEMMNEC